MGEDQGSPIVALLQALSLLWLIVAIAYVLMWRDDQTLNKMRYGLSIIVIMSLPVTLFESLYTVNLLSVNYGVIFSISAAKLIMWILGLVVGTLSSDLATGGLYAMFLTLGNDIAFGVPLMQNLYPSLVPYDLFLCCISELVFNPMSYFVFELAHKNKEGGKANLGSIFINVIAEPMVIFAILGLVCNAIFNIGLGHCPKEKERCEMPQFLEMVYQTIGGAFNLIALLSFGLNIYGKEKALQGKNLLMPLGLVLLRVFLLPVLTMLSLSLNLFDALSLPDAQSFAFLYVLIPAGPGSVVMAIHYGLPVLQAAGGMLLSTILSAPVMLIGLAVIDVKPAEEALESSAGNAHSVAFTEAKHWIARVFGALSLFGSLWMLFVYLVAYLMHNKYFISNILHFPGRQVFMLSCSHFLFFFFSYFSGLEDLAFTHKGNVWADHLCLLGALARSMISPMICYQLQSSKVHLLHGISNMGWCPYIVIWVFAFSCVIAIDASDSWMRCEQASIKKTQRAKMCTVSFVRLAWDVVGLSLMSYSLWKLSRMWRQRAMLDEMHMDDMELAVAGVMTGGGGDDDSTASMTVSGHRNALLLAPTLTPTRRQRVDEESKPGDDAGSEGVNLHKRAHPRVFDEDGEEGRAFRIPGVMGGGMYFGAIFHSGTATEAMPFRLDQWLSHYGLHVLLAPLQRLGARQPEDLLQLTTSDIDGELMPPPTTDERCRLLEALRELRAAKDHALNALTIDDLPKPSMEAGAGAGAEVDASEGEKALPKFHPQLDHTDTIRALGQYRKEEQRRTLQHAFDPLNRASSGAEPRIPSIFKAATLPQGGGITGSAALHRERASQKLADGQAEAGAAVVVMEAPRTHGLAGLLRETVSPMPQPLTHELERHLLFSLDDSTYTRLFFIFFFYTVFTLLDITHVVYTDILGEDYTGATNVVYIFREAMGYSTGFIVFVLFGCTNEVTKHLYYLFRCGRGCNGCCCTKKGGSKFHSINSLYNHSSFVHEEIKKKISAEAKSIARTETGLKQRRNVHTPKPEQGNI